VCKDGLFLSIARVGDALSGSGNLHCFEESSSGAHWEDRRLVGHDQHPIELPRERIVKFRTNRSFTIPSFPLYRLEHLESCHSRDFRLS